MKPKSRSPLKVDWRPKGATVERKIVEEDDTPPFTPDPPKKAHRPAQAPVKKAAPAKDKPRTPAPVKDKPATKAPVRTKKAAPATNVADTSSEKLLVLHTNESGKTRIVMVLSPDHKDDAGNVTPMLSIRQQFRRGDDPDWRFSKSGVSTPATEAFLKRLVVAANKMLPYV